MMLERLFPDAASRFPDRWALVEGRRKLTYRELLRVVSVLGGMLKARGVEPGGTAAIQIPNSAEAVAAILAATRLAVTLLLLDPALKTEEVERHCARAGARTLLLNVPGAQGAVQTRVSPMVVSLAEILAQAARGESECATAEPHEYRAGQAAVLFLSSGTTGRPKIVPRTAAQLEAAVQIYHATVPYLEADRVLCLLPFFHSFGLANMLLAPLAAGAQLHLETFSPRVSAASVERERITVLWATPFIFRLLAQTEFRQAPDFSSVRLAISTSAAMLPAVAAAFRAQFGIAVAQAYGMTETGPVTLARSAEYVDEPGWVGQAYEGVSVDIRDPNGHRVEAGRLGQVVVRSPAAFSSYVGESEASAAVTKDGWVMTGDIGRLDERGNLFLLGRDKPMLNVAGKKVSPSEVEACLAAHLAVGEVLVVGAATADGNERIKAFVAPTRPTTVIELQEHCAKRLADFKVPREIVFVESLAGGPMGKPSPASLQNRGEALEQS
jgi:acyl-CoA synthetase (AMP-forming)/AMP-acid ligase II